MEKLDFHDLYWDKRLGEGELLDKKLDLITDKINEIIEKLNDKN